MTFSLLTWCLWSCPEPEQSWTFTKKAWTSPGRPYYYILYFQKLIASPTTVRQKEERDIPGPLGQPRGEELLADSFLILVASEGTYCAFRATPCEKELPCRFLSHPVTLSQFGHTPSSQHIEKGMANHSSILAWRIPCAEEPGGIIVQGVTKSGTWLSDFHFLFAVWIYWKLKSFLWLFVNASYRFS